MPLETQIKRKGKTLTLGWTPFALSAMLTALTKEHNPSLALNDQFPTFGDLNTIEIDGLEVERWVNFMPAYIYAWPIPLMEKGEQVVKERHIFKEQDQVLELLPGDVCLARRTVRS